MLTGEACTTAADSGVAPVQRRSAPVKGTPHILSLSALHSLLNSSVKEPHLFEKPKTPAIPAAGILGNVAFGLRY